MNHSPNKCAICGEYHCLAGCVPVETCMAKSTSVQGTLPTLETPQQVEAFAEFGGQDGKKQTLIDLENELSKLKAKPLPGQINMVEEVGNEI